MSRFTSETTLTQHPLGDPAFEPQPNYDFADAHSGADAAFHHAQGNVTASGAYVGHHPSYSNGAGGFCLTPSSGLLPSPGSMFPAINDIWSDAMSLGIVSRAGDRPVDAMHRKDSIQASIHSRRGGQHHFLQSDIIKTRGGRVSESHGNLTPPDDDFMIEMAKAAPADERKAFLSLETGQALDRSERARNAAVQRHAKSKKKPSRESQRSDSDSDDSDGDVEDKREKYREKNRAAAAKCRAKKKTHVERIEQDARTLETENALLKARVRDLRNQHAELRDLALQHNRSVGGCHCTPLHQYNMSKAAEITSTFNAFAGLRAASTPSQDGLGSASGSPSSADADMRNQSMPIGSRRMNSQPHPHAFASSSNIAFASVATPESIQMSSMGAVDDDAPSFSNFVHGGNDGQGRYR